MAKIEVIYELCTELLSKYVKNLRKSLKLGQKWLKIPSLPMSIELCLCAGNYRENEKQKLKILESVQNECVKK